MKRLTALLIDDHALVRQGCRQALEAMNVDVVAEADNGEQGFQEFLSHRPRLVVMDLSMAAGGGIEAIRRIRGEAPDARILVLSMHDEPAIAARALNAGALGYVTKTARAQDFVDAIKHIADGEHYLSHDIALALAISSSGRKGDPLSSLTDREFEIFQMLVDGQTTAEISANLGLSPKSVTNIHLRIKHKLNTRSLADLVRLAISTGAGKRNILPNAPQE
ncbi:MAG: response regulator [Gammaproteobacteria bacterium]